MRICLVVNAKLCDPSMLSQEINGKALPTIEKIAQTELIKDIVLKKKSKTTRKGNMNFGRLG